MIAAADERDEVLAGLDSLVREAAAQPKDDIVLLALHVACGAAAVEELRRTWERPS